MKKNSVLVHQVLMSALTAVVFACSFTSCSDDDIETSPEVATIEKADGAAAGTNAVKQPYGLVYTDFISPSDVQILNADTTEIAVSKAYADKMQINDFVNHPMGIWQSLDERAYMRKATAQRLVGDRYILTVVRSGLGEVLASQDVELNTCIYVNPDAAKTRGMAADRYTDSHNRIHPAAVAVTRRAGQTTRGAYNEYGVLTAEDILNGANFSLPQTRGFFSDAYDKIKEFTKFIENIAKNGVHFKGEKTGKMLGISGDITPPKIHIKLGDNEGDTLTIHSKIPYDVALDYTIKLDSRARARSIDEMISKWTLNPIDFSCDYFEGRVDGSVEVAPEMTVGFGAKLEVPEDKQNIKLCDLTEFTFTFMAGVIPVAITVQPALYFHVNAAVEGKVYTGFKYEYASEFSAGVKYDKKNGGWKAIKEYNTTKNDFSFIRPRGTFKAEAEAGVVLQCDVLVDGLVGPTVGLGPLVKAELAAKLGLYDEVPFTFEAGVKAGIYGRTGAKVKLWKLELFDWETELRFGEWDIWSYQYPKADDKKDNKDNEKLNRDAEDLAKEIEAEAAKKKAEAERVKADNEKYWSMFVQQMKNDPDVKRVVARMKPSNLGYLKGLVRPLSVEEQYDRSLTLTRRDYKEIYPGVFGSMKSKLLTYLRAFGDGRLR